MRILIMGPQGSGKTTQARIVAEKLGMCVVKTGDLVRQKAQEDSDEGRLLKHSLETGELSDDNLVATLLEQDLNHPKCESGVVVDGFPRRMSQLEVFDPKYDWVYYLDISDELATERMLKRGREDDTPEVIKERLKVFHAETTEVKEYYQSLNKLIMIDGEKQIDEVTAAILADLKDKK